MMKFEPITGDVSPTPGLVLKVARKRSGRNLFRITHVFDTCVYGIWVSDAAGAHDARRPEAKSFQELASLKGAWGRLSLPDELIPNSIDDAKGIEDDTAWSIIEPLVLQQQREANLGRAQFSSAIAARAEALDATEVTVRRLLLRYYYFGLTKSALGRARPGPKPANNSTSAFPATSQSTHRRGRKGRAVQLWGPNEFVISEAEVHQLVLAAIKWTASSRPLSTFLVESYLPGIFAKNRPELYKRYLDGQHPPPITYRQLGVYVSAYRKQLRTMALAARGAGTDGSLTAMGPGSVYEIDATGGRIELIAQAPDGNLRSVGRPTIYLLIDRDSRYIPAIYVSLKSPSWEEARQLLLVAFTDRVKRFKPLNINVDNKRWPRGVICHEMVQDQGSDFMSGSFAAALGDLRITPCVLPGATPNGKAIVERFFRTLKAKMASRFKSAFAKASLDRETKLIAKQSERCAVFSLADLYRELIEIVIEHNNKIHKALKRRADLRIAGIKPTPQAAYLWGLENISGMQVHPFTDEQVRRMCLTSGRGSITDEGLLFERRVYLPNDTASSKILGNATAKRTGVAVRYDPLEPFEIYVQEGWAKFTMRNRDQNELKGTVLEDAQIRHEIAELLATSVVGNQVRQQLRDRQQGEQNPVKTLAARTPRAQGKPTTPTPAERKDLRASETRDVKRAMADTSSKPSTPAKRAAPVAQTKQWETNEQAAMAKAMAEIRKRAGF